MDLRGFEAVVAVHEHGSFSAAAVALFITQSALTRRVALLERELDTLLFVRTPRGAVLTDTGQALLGPARRALHETQVIRNSLDLIRSGIRGSLSIVGMANTNASLLGRVLGQFHSAFPEVEMRVVAVESTRVAMAMVEAEVHDIAIVDLPCVSDSLTAIPVVKQEFLAAFGKGGIGVDSPQQIPTVTKTMLAGRTVVHLPTREFPIQRGMQLFDMLGVQPAGHIEVAMCGLLMPFARMSNAVAILPDTIAWMKREDEVDLARPPKPIFRTLGFAHHRGNKSAAVKQFAALAATMAESVA